MKEVEFIEPASVNAEWDDTGLAHISVLLTQRDIQRIIKLAKTVRKLNVCSINDWDEPSKYLAENDEEIEFRAECNMIVITYNSFYYEGLVKHTESSWSSDRIPIATLEEIESVWKAPDSELPLLVGTLQTPQAQQALEERLKEK